jgi:hypothetical protein
MRRAVYKGKCKISSTGGLKRGDEQAAGSGRRRKRGEYHHTMYTIGPFYTGNEHWEGLTP